MEGKESDKGKKTGKRKRKVIRSYERRMQKEIAHPVFGYKVSYRRVLEVQARLLARVIYGEIKEYPAFVTR
jgi:CRISPR-associated protein Cas1